MDAPIVKLLLIVVVILAISLWGTYRSYDTVDDDKFKRVKIKKFKFLFMAIGHKDVEKHGVILPFFIFQVASYILAIAVFIIGIINIQTKESIGKLPFYVLGCEAVSFAILKIALTIKSKKRSSAERNNTAENER